MPFSATPPFYSFSLPSFMGKGLPSSTSLERTARFAAERIRRARVAKPSLQSLDSSRNSAAASKDIGRGMNERDREVGRVPLKDVVADCSRRWFQDALKEARAGDAAMQVLVGQMYHSGYGIPKNEQKANAWITKASKYRSSVWKVSDKRPGYNASDSDSDEEKIIIKS